MPTNRSALLPTLALTLMTAVWGSTFFLIKDLLQQVPPLDFLGSRFGLAAILVILFQFNRLRSAGRIEWVRGGLLAVLYSCGQLLQTIGLQYTDASISGFITGMYVVLTPILIWVLFGKKISAKVWIAVAMATGGLAFLSIQGNPFTGEGVPFRIGELLTLASALFYALHIVFLGRWAHQSEPVTLGLIQIVGAGIILGAAALPGGVALPQTVGAWSSFLYMTIVAGLGAVVVQTWAQSRLNATTAAVIMTTEPVFAAAFAIAFGGEPMTSRLLLGGALVLTAMVLVETGGTDDKPSSTPPDAGADEVEHGSELIEDPAPLSGRSSVS
ncbi:DMT family transporter [Actinomyces minihominis]|uniref:DMT family transporter n=1 Tax=Actinomyces minihominis TaxID=2002838 RepID=UPI001F5CC7F9|nr:DMT family transporter [Actinomyces minihominis]